MCVVLTKMRFYSSYEIQPLQPVISIYHLQCIFSPSNTKAIFRCPLNSILVELRGLSSSQQRTVIPGCYGSSTSFNLAYPPLTLVFVFSFSSSILKRSAQMSCRMSQTSGFICQLPQVVVNVSHFPLLPVS